MAKVAAEVLEELEEEAKLSIASLGLSLVPCYQNDVLSLIEHIRELEQSAEKIAAAVLEHCYGAGHVDARMIEQTTAVVSAVLTGTDDGSNSDETKA